VQAKNIYLIFGRFSPLLLYTQSKEWDNYPISKYALIHRAHPPNISNTGTLKMNVLLNEE